MKLSNSQIDRLGDRLRRKEISDADLATLDEFRLSFTTAYKTVVEKISDEFSIIPGGRPTKSTTSIREKLRREKIRLTQMQDIAGCRIVVSHIAEQDRIVKQLAQLFAGSRIVDRRRTPSHGYRAVHVIASIDRAPIEIQVRTILQHRWAESCERLADRIDPPIKYGEGPRHVQDALRTGSEWIATMEEKIPDVFVDLRTHYGENPQISKTLENIESRLMFAFQHGVDSLFDILDKFSLEDPEDDISNRVR